MHELSIIEDIFKTLLQVAKDNKLTKISTVKLKIGKMRQVIPETLSAAFDSVSKKTIVENATLDVKYIPIKAHCNDCSQDSLVKDLHFFCPKCNSTNINIIEGKEIILDSVDGDNA